MKLEDAFKTLGVPRNASLEEVEDAFENLSLLYHPDRFAPAVREDQEKKYNRISEAYNTILKLSQRALKKPAFEESSFQNTLKRSNLDDTDRLYHAEELTTEIPFEQVALPTPALKDDIIRHSKTQIISLKTGVLDFLSSLTADNKLQVCYASSGACYCKKICECRLKTVLNCKSCKGAGWTNYCEACKGSGTRLQETILNLEVDALRHTYTWFKVIDSVEYSICLDVCSEKDVHIRTRDGRIFLEKDCIIKLSQYLDAQVVELNIPFLQHPANIDLSKIESFPTYIDYDISNNLISKIRVNLKLKNEKF